MDITTIDSATLDFFINHLFLPPKLPDEDDSSTDSAAQHKRELIRFFIRALGVYCETIAPDGEKGLWEASKCMLERMYKTRTEDYALHFEELIKEFQTLKSGESVALHIEGQNAGILFQSSHHKVVFSAFEAAPTSAAVMKAKGRLLRRFPGTQVSIDRSEFLNIRLLEQLTDFICRVNAEVFEEALPKARKAGLGDITEERDTIHPKFITEMLTGILRGMGEATKTTGFQKCYRDDVIDGSKLAPWRRSPLLLVIKVALQSVLIDHSAPNPHQRYKSFMLFALSRIVVGAKRANLSNGMLFELNAKLSRRIQKLGHDIPPPLFRKLHVVSSNIGAKLKETWKTLQTSGNLIWRTQNMPNDPSTELAVPKFRKCIKETEKHGAKLPTRPNFIVPEMNRVIQSPYHFPSLDFGLNQFENFHVGLADVEIWVRDHLDAWLEWQGPDGYDEAAECLATLYKSYMLHAQDSYDGLPEDISIMTLTIFHIWVALDKASMACHPFLGSYNPGFELSFFDHLLLPQRRQLEQLAKLKDYINNRIENANPTFPSPFCTALSVRSFLVVCFRELPQMAEHKQDIEKQATRERDAKIKEFQLKTDAHAALTNQISRMVCGVFVNKIYGYSKHDNKCRRCKLSEAAKQIKITIHEWPLPEDENSAKAVVSENFLPIRLRVWRDLTYGLLQDACAGREAQPEETVYTSHEYSGLSNHVYPPRTTLMDRRLCLASYKKPFLVTHYGNPITITKFKEESICKPNAMQYGLYDSLLHEMTVDTPSSKRLKSACSIELRSPVYRALQHTSDGTRHTTNEVLADQNNCHQDLTLQEFYSFGSLRAGHRLQWRSIAREITAQGLNFSAEDVHSLLTQAAWQVGPCGDALDMIPESHQDLTEPSFAVELLNTIASAIEDISTNWKGVTAMRTYIMLLSRILSLSEPGGPVEQRAASLLFRARAYCKSWIRDLTGKFKDASDSRKVDPTAPENGHELRKTLSLRILEACIACTYTYNPERYCIEENTKDDLAMAIECSIWVKRHLSISPELQPIIRRHYRVLLDLQPLVRHYIQEGEFGFASAPIKQFYKAYWPTGSWELHSSGWLETFSYIPGFKHTQICVNLLEGTLLVAGSPLARLPEEYENHPSYRRLFNEKVLDVVRSKRPEMMFMTSSPYNDGNVYFAMKEGDLVIRFEIEGHRTGERLYYEYIPHENLDGDLSHDYIHNHFHWYLIEGHTQVNCSSFVDIVEFRKSESVWPKYFQDFTKKIGTVLEIRDEIATLFERFGHGQQFTIDNESTFGKMICKALSPIERPEHISIIFNKKQGRIYANLLRLNLNFAYVPKDGLYCQGFRSMVVDESSQDIGALTGLKSKLVLKNMQSGERCVVVPFGKARYHAEGDHVNVVIDSGDAERVQHFVYTVDKELGRLVGTGSLRSQLFKIFLHALTSHCLPDVLTGQTGTEMALAELSSAGTRSFEKLDEGDVKLLKQIGKLTPQRFYYPKHLRYMQRVIWRDLPPLSQHAYFLPIVRSILDQAQKQQIFTDISIEIPVLEYEHHLQRRAALRNSAYYVDLAPPIDSTADLLYTPRDQPASSGRESLVCTVSRLVENWSTQLNVSWDILARIEGWKAYSIADRNSQPFVFGFNTEFLRPTETALPSTWCTLQHALSKVDQTQKYGVLFFFSTMAYSPRADRELIETLLAFATVPQFKNLEPPSGPFYLNQGYKNDLNQIIHMVGSHILQFTPGCLEWQTERASSSEPDEKYYPRIRAIFERARDGKVRKFAKQLLASWLEEAADLALDSTDSNDFKHYITPGPAIAAVKLQLQSWHRNRQFKSYIQSIQQTLVSIPRPSLFTIPYPAATIQFKIALSARRSRGVASLDDLLSTREPPPEFILRTRRFTVRDLETPTFHQPDHLQKVGNTAMEVLDALLGSLRLRSLVKDKNHDRRYYEDLTTSFAVLKSRGVSHTQEEFALGEALTKSIESLHRLCMRIFEGISRKVLEVLKPQNLSELSIYEAGLWPRLTTQSILSNLRESSFRRLTPAWQSAVIEYGLAFADLQHLKRILKLLESQQSQQTQAKEELMVEISNMGRTHWNPSERPEWLLFEIENNIRIREPQISVAKSMMDPPNGANSVILFPIGKGKTSVVVPIVASALADGKKLVRIFVLKPLSSQMFNILRVRLGGMLNRRIFYLPFSRSMKMDLHKASIIRELLQECMIQKGILLVQPEHALSFELMGLERMLAAKEAEDVGRHLSETQRWLSSNTRDILDESDEILSVRFELIYTIGVQKNIEFAPERWRIITDVLGSVRRNAQEVLQRFPDGLELAGSLASKGSFRRLRILSAEAGKKLLELVTNDIVSGYVKAIPSRLPQDAVRQFITSLKDDENNMAVLKDRIGESSNTWNALLLLRGLISGGILAFVFWGKRWRVNYGLDLSRSSLAVPYRGKDSPSTRAEFSHPDAAIALTALCYYYGGLTEDQLRVCFERVLATEECEEEYRKWVRDSDVGLPSRFRYSYRNINLMNNVECSKDLFPYFVYAKSTIDYYLSNVIFPKEVKEYPYKLSSSGWDVAREKVHPTTGFSGTNDSRYVLPTSINQCDDVDQQHTNAEMLSCILRAENQFLDLGWTSDWTSRTLLNKLSSGIRVIIDVGAQILDLKNEEAARYWLLEAPKFQEHCWSDTKPSAVIFFNESSELCVLTKDHSGSADACTVEPLLVSPFAKKLEECLVYLDEVHTRGTDLNLPTDYRAAVTLGVGLTKDRLVQACMRMRKLGKGQQITFIGPKEIQNTIYELIGTKSKKITVSDILRWSMAETCKETQKSIGLWYIQGVRHQQQSAIRKAIGEAVLTPETARAFLDQEAHSLRERYGGNRNVFKVDETGFTHEEVENMKKIRNRCNEIGGIKGLRAGASMQEEQERELSPEAERQVQIERPPEMEALSHKLSASLKELVETGVFPAKTPGFVPAFTIFNKTSAAAFGFSTDEAWSADLLVTSDFATTVIHHLRKYKNQDHWIRPVHWIVSTVRHPGKYLIISPFEANKMIPRIRDSSLVNLHVYSPRVSRSMSSLDSLTEFSFQQDEDLAASYASPITQLCLNFFSGQLYLEDRETYLEICKFLGITPSVLDKSSARIGLDGFVHPEDRPLFGDFFENCKFQKSPIPFLMEILKMRRKGLGVDESEMGRILGGRILSDSEFQQE